MTSTTVNGSRTPMPGAGGRGALVRATVETLRSCGCGQALDADQAPHCPRCGVVVRRGTVTTPGRLLAVA